LQELDTEADLLGIKTIRSAQIILPEACHPALPAKLRRTRSRIPNADLVERPLANGRVSKQRRVVQQTHSQPLVVQLAPCARQTDAHASIPSGVAVGRGVPAGMQRWRDQRRVDSWFDEKRSSLLTAAAGTENDESLDDGFVEAPSATTSSARPSGEPLRMSHRIVRLSTLTLALTLSSVRPASARSGGIVANSCDGCHAGNSGGPPELTLVADPAVFDPGESVTFTLSIANPSVRTGGAFITASGVGAFQTLPGENLAINDQGLAQNSPKGALDGAVTFRFVWQAPADPGGVSIYVAAVAADGNNRSNGDAAASASFSWVFGCSGREFFADLDRDGYGSAKFGVRLACADQPAPTGYAALDGDCDENNENVNPGAAEICNRKDDDCNGEIDENAPPVEMWPDDDGDGYYASRTTPPEIGCDGLAGFAVLGGDCDDSDATLNPGAMEICNGKDDDCDGDIDDRVRPQCGVGWCRRNSSTCDPADCEPGPPNVEICNSFDDDCDGVIDNDACPTGMVCKEFECVAGDPEFGDPPGSEPTVAADPTTAVSPTPASVPGVVSSSPMDTPGEPANLPASNRGDPTAAPGIIGSGAAGVPSGSAQEPSVSSAQSTGCALRAIEEHRPKAGRAAYALVILLFARFWRSRHGSKRGRRARRA